jgi:hypothetical protein
MAGSVSFFTVWMTVERAPIADGLVPLGLGIAGWVVLAPIFVRIGVRLRRIRQRPWMIHLFTVTYCVNFGVMVLCIAEGFHLGRMLVAWQITGLPPPERVRRIFEWTQTAGVVELWVLLLFVKRPVPLTSSAMPGHA